MLNGILNVYKEKGYTSHDVVAKLRGIAGQKKIGHTGTLDPQAEGVLPVCLGKATKVCDLLTDKDKVYEAVLLLGQTTDTQDTTGTVLEQSAVTCSEEEVKKAIMGFVGAYAQIPPMYSALKVNGKKLCDLARNGIEVERKPRPVQIYEIEIENIELPRVTMRVHCSKGTYIRTLCHDIGLKLGCGGCMESLKRTRVADFSIEQALTLGEIEKKRDAGELEQILYPTDYLFRALEAVTVQKKYGKVLYNGNRIAKAFFVTPPISDEAESIRIYDEEGRFIGIYRYDKRQENYKPVKIFLEQ